MIADELRRQAGVFTDLVELKAKITPNPSERPARERESRYRSHQFPERETTASLEGNDSVLED